MTDHQDHTDETQKDEGFTLVEVMVVMLIIALMVAFVAVNVIPAGDKARVQKAQADIAIYEQALEQFRLDMGDYPPSEIGLEALKELPAGAPNEDRYRPGGYIKRVQNDPWDNPYIYRYPGENGVFDIVSLGSDGQPGGEKLAADITNWED